MFVTIRTTIVMQAAKELVNRFADNKRINKILTIESVENN